jgi:hypothetical protein
MENEYERGEEGIIAGVIYLEYPVKFSSNQKYEDPVHGVDQDIVKMHEYFIALKKEPVKKKTEPEDGSVVIKGSERKKKLLEVNMRCVYQGGNHLLVIHTIDLSKDRWIVDAECNEQNKKDLAFI